MATKDRTYRKLTTGELKKVRKYTKQGLSQGKIAKRIGVAAQSVATAQKKAQIGKRSPFQKDVKAYRKISGDTQKEAVQVIKYSRKWKKAYKKRTGKARVSETDILAIRAALREEWLALAEDAEYGGIEYEGEKYYDTPH